MTTVTQLVASDTQVREIAPTRNYAGLTYLTVSNAGSNRRIFYIYFSRPFPLGATIVSATLKFYQTASATGGSRVLDTRLLAGPYQESKLTWDNRPSSVGATASSGALGDGGGVGREWPVDVTALMQSVSDGAGWYGLSVATTNTTPLSFFSREAAQFQPILEIEWADEPGIPSVLAPSNGRAVSVARPILRFDFSDVSGDTSMAGYQLQMNLGAEDAVSPDYDSGVVAANVPEHLVTFDVAAAEVWFWRSQTQDAAGLWSGWSDWVSFTRTAKPTLTITNPAVAPDDFVSESTPPISWTATGQVAYQVFITDPVDTTEVLWTSGKVTSTDNSVTLPDLVTPILSPGGTYSVTVRVWDGVERESTPGDPVFVEASRVFTFDLSVSVTPVSSFTVTGAAPRPEAVLGWTRATAPDSFTILRDGVTVAENLVPADLLVSGTTYEYVDTAAPPRGAGHEWSVLAVVGGVSSDSNPTASLTLSPEGIWLSKPDGSLSLLIGGDGFTAEPHEDSTVHSPLGATNPVLITQAIHGRRGHVDGFLRAHGDVPGVSVADWLEMWDTIRSVPGQTLNLVLSDTAMKVFIHNALTAPAEEFADSIPIAFDYCELV